MVSTFQYLTSVDQWSDSLPNNPVNVSPVSHHSTNSSVLDSPELLLLRPFACPYPGCPKRFKRRYTLKDHLNAHTGEKPFVCPVRSCRKTFTTSGNLSRHKRLHPWLDTPLQCLVPSCHCEFPSDHKLQRHMLSHFGESSVHRCEAPACGRVFSTPGNLRRHMKQRHENLCRREISACMMSSAEGASAEYTPSVFVYTGSPQDTLLSHDQELLETLTCLFDEQETKSVRSIHKLTYAEFLAYPLETTVDCRE